MQEVSLAERIADRVEKLLGNSGLSNMAFTDGEEDKYASSFNFY